MREIDASRLTALQQARPDCQIYPNHISTLAEFIEISSAVTERTQRYWFRGHGSANWSLTPSALRHSSEKKRTTALEAIDSFKRLAATKIRDAPPPNDDLQWIQIGRHYGLPTRLLDWTENAAIGLYFACEHVIEDGKEQDGLTFILDPIELNVIVDRTRPRILDAYRDADLIMPYFELKGRSTPRGRPSIALDPVWNSERLVLQKGKFTLHGAGEFALSTKQAPSLVALAVLSEDKDALLNELQTIGIDEMSIFPEPEHVCSYICQVLGLKVR